MTVAVIMRSDLLALHQHAAAIVGALDTSNASVSVIYFHSAGVNVVVEDALASLWRPLSGPVRFLVCSSGLQLRGIDLSACSRPFAVAGLAEGFDNFLGAEKTVVFN